MSSCLYAGFSVGASFGLRLYDGREIFLKINKPTLEEDSIHSFSLESLTAISKVQKHLWEGGFPCPEVVLLPKEYRDTIITVNGFSDIGKQIDAHSPNIRKLMAEKLAELIQKTEQHKYTSGLPSINVFSKKTLYPIPHNALFDFENTGKGAEWIDELASKSKKTILSIDKHMVLGHCDWSLKHFRFEKDKVLMIYDWDSLYVQDEYYVLAIAAGSFTTTWDIPVKITPSQEEAYEFVREYEYVRGRRFTAEEMKKISAYITYFMAYTARCEFSNDQENNNFEGSFRQSLRTMRGDNYLNL